MSYFVFESLFQYVKSDRDPINPLDAAKIYRIEYTDKNRDKGYCIGVTKWKINGRIKEHQGNIKNGKNNITIIARLALNKNIKTDFNKTKKAFKL